VCAGGGRKRRQGFRSCCSEEGGGVVGDGGERDKHVHGGWRRVRLYGRGEGEDARERHVSGVCVRRKLGGAVGE